VDGQKALEQYLKLGGRPYNRTKFRMFVNMLGPLEGKRILDYGGGAGILAVPLAKGGADVVVVDAEENALRTARLYAAREGVTRRVHTVHSTSVPAAFMTEGFDIVIAKDIVEHIPEDGRLLRDLWHCHKPGGTLVLSTQNSWSLNYLVEGAYQKHWRGNRDWLGWDTTHVRFYDPPALRQKLTAAGYDVADWAGVYLVPYDIFSWLALKKVEIRLVAFRYLDFLLGRTFPFNRLGWNIIVKGTKPHPQAGTA
jgi:2-polyprenyl-6-hydroxyphenyl methylase/3-demethylubiquinone-9 3-methyltransferase